MLREGVNEKHKTETGRGRVAGRKGEEFSIRAKKIETKHLNSIFFFLSRKKGCWTGLVQRK